MSVRLVSFKTLYKVGWSEIQDCRHLGHALVDATCAIFICRNVSLATAKWSHTLKFHPVFLKRVITLAAQGKFLGSSADGKFKKRPQESLPLCRKVHLQKLPVHPTFGYVLFLFLSAVRGMEMKMMETWKERRLIVLPDGSDVALTYWWSRDRLSLGNYQGFLCPTSTSFLYFFGIFAVFLIIFISPPF